jgi:hypothetical protein
MLLSAPALAAEALPDKGESRLAAYEVCHPLALIDMGAAGSEASTECQGIVRNLDGQKPPDNLAIHCLEATSSRPDAYKYEGTCIQTDSDGDKIFMTYGGAKSGTMQWIGGTGKYEGLTGQGDLGVVVAPGNTPAQFAFTLSYTVNWTRKK